MGRIFETRKHTMFARWDKMAKQFARIGKEITIAVKAGGPDPAANPPLRRVIQNARAVNMPKDKVEAAIKRASGKDAANYEEILYEGYAPHGIAVLVETATDNPTRTVSNLRTHFNKGGGTLGNTGSVGFLFKRMGVFRLNPAGLEQDELELELIDHGLEEMGESTGREGRAAARHPLRVHRLRPAAEGARGPRHHAPLRRVGVHPPDARRAARGPGERGAEAGRPAGAGRRRAEGLPLSRVMSSADLP